MARRKAQITVSADGYMAGPNQGREHPLGEGGEELHEWALETEAFQRMHGRSGGVDNASSRLLAECAADVGAVVMGRNMFGPVRGPWAEEPEWRGWWGDEPPFHAPVFVLTHHAREPLEMAGGTSFHFVTEGFERALELAEGAADGRDVSVAGGAATVQQCIRAGRLDELVLHVVPLILGGGVRLLDQLPPGVKLEQRRVVAAPAVTHIVYAVSGGE